MSKLNFKLLFSGMVLMLKFPFEIKAQNTINNFFNFSNVIESYNTNNSDLGEGSSSSIYAQYLGLSRDYTNDTDYWSFGNWSTNDTEFGGGFDFGNYLNYGYYEPSKSFYFFVGHNSCKTKR